MFSAILEFIWGFFSVKWYTSKYAKCKESSLFLTLGGCTSQATLLCPIGNHTAHVTTLPVQISGYAPTLQCTFHHVLHVSVISARDSPWTIVFLLLTPWPNSFLSISGCIWCQVKSKQQMKTLTVLQYDDWTFYTVAQMFNLLLLMKNFKKQKEKLWLDSLVYSFSFILSTLSHMNFIIQQHCTYSPHVQFTNDTRCWKCRFLGWFWWIHWSLLAKMLKERIKTIPVFLLFIKTLRLSPVSL